MAERALRIERGASAVMLEVPIGLPLALTVGEQAVWVSDVQGQIWRINPDTAAVTQTTSVGVGLLGLCAADGAVWATVNAEGTVARIDPGGGRVVGHVTVGHAPTDIAFDDGCSGFRSRARALSDGHRNRDLTRDDFSPDVVDLCDDRAGHLLADDA